MRQILLAVILFVLFVQGVGFLPISAGSRRTLNAAAILILVGWILIRTYGK